MRFTNFSLLALVALLSVSVNAQELGDDNVVPRPGDDRVVQPPVQPPVVPGQEPGDDNVVPRPGDDRVVQPPVQPPVVPGQEPGDDNVVPRPGDDRGTNGTTTTTRPSPTAVPTNSAMKNSMGTLGVASLFAYFLF